MTVAILGVDRDHLTLRCDDPAFDEARELEPGATARFERWAEDYRRALRKETNAAELLTIGRAIFAWLDGDANWIERLRREARPPLLLEIAVSLRPTSLEHAFLEAPWELLADAAGHLAADPSLVFCPVRRLGTASKPDTPSDHRLSLVFMAAAPDGATSLDYESEERAILDATSGIGLDLVVEESGSLPALVDMMAAEAPVDILHISCHGLSEGGPRLLLEDELGKRAAATADDFAQRLGDNLPRRLLFLSACLSADRPSSGDLVGSFAATMIQRGCPAALGWGGSVKDSDSTRFAAELLERLSHKAPLEGAMARARHALIAPPAGARIQAPADDWHLARLYVGAKGGGRFIKGNRARRRLAADHGHSEFLDRKNATVPVTSAREFVGRRRSLQHVLSALRPSGGARVVIHGIGGHGKSSLAARVAHRLVDHTLVVVVERFDAVAILDAIERAVMRQDVRDFVKERREIVRADPASLALGLRAILEGPCREIQRDAFGHIVAKPLLLVLDNLEDILLPSTVGLHTVKPSVLESICAVVKAFDNADTTSGLLITSRYDFTLPDRDGRDLAAKIMHEALGPMSPSEGEKQASAKLRTRAESIPVDRQRARRCIRTARGNPRLQSLLFLYAVETPPKCDEMLDQMEQHLADGSAPGAEALRDFLENLALDMLIALLSVGEIALLRASTLFSIPVPVDILAKLGEAVGANASEATGTRLISLGLWEQIAKPTGSEAFVNALVRPRLAPLGDEERRVMAAAVLGVLLDRWTGQDGSQRTFSTDKELVQIGIASGQTLTVVAVVADVVRELSRLEEFREAAALGLTAIAALDAAADPVPLRLLRETGAVCSTIGNVEAMHRCSDRSIALVRELRSIGNTVEPELHASILLAHGRRLDAEGSPDAALRAYEEALALFKDAHSRHGHAVTLGDIARLRAQKGEVDAALALHNERFLVFQDLGDYRECAIALGEIARLRADKGEINEALALHNEALRVYEALGDRRSRATVLGDIARLRADKGEVDEALALHNEQLKIQEEMGSRRARAITLGDIARLRADRGDFDAALNLLAERLQILAALGDLDGMANTHWLTGRIASRRGDDTTAAHHLTVSYEISDKLGRMDAICVVGLDLARSLLAIGHKSEAIQILNRSREGFMRFGRHDYMQQVQGLLDDATHDS